MRWINEPGESLKLAGSTSTGIYRALIGDLYVIYMYWNC
jgi:hypothetical protein